MGYSFPRILAHDGVEELAVAGGAGVGGDGKVAVELRRQPRLDAAAQEAGTGKLAFTVLSWPMPGI